MFFSFSGEQWLTGGGSKLAELTSLSLPRIITILPLQPPRTTLRLRPPPPLSPPKPSELHRLIGILRFPPSTSNRPSLHHAPLLLPLLRCDFALLFSVFVFLSSVINLFSGNLFYAAYAICFSELDAVWYIIDNCCLQCFCCPTNYEILCYLIFL